ncbi:hypothetical protein [Peptoniphilus sp.]|uniref:hypothetical protein n=1 Tax=Peptoniphilus sp. TaxID=1971214 RepID=UPI0039933ACA
MLTYNQDFSNEEIQGSIKYVNTNGVYIGKIVEAYIFRSRNTMSEALNLTILTEEDTSIKLRLFYKGRNGEEIKFNMKPINDLMFIIKRQNLPEGSDGKIPSLLNQEIGAIITVDIEYTSSGNQMYGYNLKGFYDPKTGGTVYELQNNKPFEKVAEFILAYKDAVPVLLDNTTKQVSKDENNSNNGGNFFPVNDEEIPF